MNQSYSKTATEDRAAMGKNHPPHAMGNLKCEADRIAAHASDLGDIALRLSAFADQIVGSVPSDPGPAMKGGEPSSLLDSLVCGNNRAEAHIQSIREAMNRLGA